MSINRVFLTGNLTRDPDLRATASGLPVMSVGIAVNDRRKNQQTGEWEDYPNYIDCTMFGARAEAVSKYLSKGSKVAIEGKLRWSQWMKDDEKRSGISVIIDQIEFLFSRKEIERDQDIVEEASEPYQTQMEGMDDAQVGPYSGSIYNEDIPF